MNLRTVTSAIALASALQAVPSAAPAQPPTPTRIVVNGAELHYIEQGQGEPLILLHGGQGDYRMWGPQMAAFSPQYRVLSYSRRYHYPNDNPPRADYSPLLDADDLAGFINQLGLGRVHLVGTSIGAFAALVLSLKHPELVRSMVLAEAPLLAWAASSPTGAPLYRDFMARTHERAAPLFARGDDEGGMRVFIDAFDGEGTLDRLPPERRRTVMDNVGYFRAITAARDPYPNLSKEAVRALGMPILLIHGQSTNPVNLFLSDALKEQLPRATRVVIPQAGHGSPRQNPAAFNAAVLDFLRSLK
ncbi:MAG: alpha/beta hydrolase [Gemmatimonadaceae bacterium]|nr:alpha/beta hydrolase [Gemmatimonadaceae bacterium]